MGWGWAAAVAAWACAAYVAVKLLEVLWWRPRRVEEHFARQGIRGPRYRFFIGCVREMVALMVAASAKPMPPPYRSHNVLPRVLAFYHHWKKLYGSTFLIWFGPTPRLAIAEPDLIREIFLSRSEHFDRYESHPMVRQLEGEGLVSLRGEKWAHHRRVLTPTFHMENLKLLLPFIGKTVVDMVEKWHGMAGPSGELEIDVSEWFQIVTEDAITRTAFGRSYEDGKAVFKLQTQLMAFASEAFRKVFIQILADQEEHELVEAGQGDQKEPGDAHRPAAGGRRRREEARWVCQGPPWAHDQGERRRRQEDAAGEPHYRERHSGGVQNVLLRRQADNVQPPDLDHRRARHAPGVAGARPAGGPRRLRRARHPLPRAARQAQDSRDDPERDAAAVPAGGGDGAAGKVRRGAGRVPDPAGHGAADPDHGRAPRRAALGPGRGAVQPGAVRGRRGAGGQAPDGVHTVRAGRAHVHRPEPGAPGGQAHGVHHPAAVRLPAVAQLRPRADGADAPPPAVRGAPDLPIPLVVIPAVRSSGDTSEEMSSITNLCRCRLRRAEMNDRNDPFSSGCAALSSRAERS